MRDSRRPETEALTVRGFWRRSSYSGAQEGACVEVAGLGGSVGVRDSKNPGSAYLTLSGGAFAGLLFHLKHGDPDL
ncbi:DUF397 domain-containing protein [Actinocorallia libanotica]|uniref:DUF397 domain-containing protein n=1 Tax=Actinocorallia libanotica TaxID=46162 RepID=UPI0031CDC803